MGLFGKTRLTAAHTVNLHKDPAGAPAVNLTKVRDAGHVDLAKRAEKTGVALGKRGLAGIRAQAQLVLDHSGSMYPDYDSGDVQTLVERALAFALQVNASGTVPVIPFDSRILPTVEVGVGNYAGVVNREIWRGRNMGSTNLAAALRVVMETAAAATVPIFCIVVTDGEPDSRPDTTRIVCELSRYPVFVKFLALKPVAYLAELDDLDASRRLLDNVDSKPSSTDLNLLSCTDLQFADAMVDEWDTWIAAAQKAGIVA
ncbi:VWA domain-containing protein [Dactylosporangium sp. NPDC000555]|uniref:VWA domain-containing protein n=1 Tax=Dactylosporangium sp. NPDC000555 TaxID=3154260 RepID=UPI0033258DCB